MLRASLREREYSRNLRAPAWNAVDRAFSVHGFSVVLHCSHPQSAMGVSHIETMAVVSHFETQPTFPRRVQPDGGLAGLRMLDHVGQGFFGDAVRCQSHFLWKQVTVGLLLFHKHFIQLCLNSKCRSKLIAQGLKGRDEPLVES